MHEKGRKGWRKEYARKKFIKWLKTKLNWKKIEIMKQTIDMGQKTYVLFYLNILKCLTVYA